MTQWIDSGSGPGYAEDAARAVVRTRGSSDYGHVWAHCAGCTWTGALYSRRTVEGRRLAERDRDEHNRARHAAAAR